MRHLDLFSGIGGFALASRWMGWKTVAFVDNDKYSQLVLNKNFPGIPIHGDIHKFNDEYERGTLRSFHPITNGIEERSTLRSQVEGREIHLQSHYRNWIRNDSGDLDNQKLQSYEADIITGGFPCQPFSHAGDRQGTEDPRYLWQEMLRTIRNIRPKFVVGENVSGLTSMDNGETLDRILTDLETEGYNTETFLLPACGISTWHRRERVFIIARSSNQKHSSCSNSNCNGSCHKAGEQLKGETELRNKQECTTQGLGENVSDSDNQRSQGCPKKGNTWSEGSERNELAARCDRGRWTVWDTEPRVGRVANGISKRVDRLKGLGNAVVPQIIFEIFKAIDQFEKNIQNQSIQE